MQIRELTYLPSGEVFIDETFDTAHLHADTLAGYDKWWHGAESPNRTSVNTPIGTLTVKCTFTRGRALGTWDVAGLPVLSTVLLAGFDAAADAELGEIFLNSMRNLDHVKRLAATKRPFEGFRAASDRPFVGGVFWPVVSVDQYQHIAPVTMLMTASFFRSCK